MSVQFGQWNFDGKPVGCRELDRISPMLAPYGPDAEGVFCQDNVAILFRAFHTTRESHREQQPHVLPSGAILTWDGRLDNREELRGLLGTQLPANTTDLSLVATAYERWSTKAFARLIGDWALSVWDPGNQSLVLAKDFIGTRHLYYHIDKDTLTWSTLLDPLVLFAGHTFELCEEYIAGWLSFYPGAELTPYVGIRSVPPSSSVMLRSGRAQVQRYWDFNPGARIRYRNDEDYETHFRSTFAEAVRRRLRADNPVLAELSGGMDSSSIVCMADTLFHNGDAGIGNVDTVSYYNHSEPNWNERPYFTKIEEKRGKSGCHIDVSKRELFSFSLASDDFAPTPGSCSRITDADKQFDGFLISQGSRVVLSGLGGDEVAGGVPTPMPELERLLAGAHFKHLAHQLKVWALSMRKPWWFLLLETIRAFVPVDLPGLPKRKQPVPWLNSDFARRNRLALRGYESRLRVFGPPPVFQENLSTLDTLRRQLGCEPLPARPSYEKRYPYLDRSLLEFLYAIPREQLVRPGQRRSLVRRALVGIVPDEILNRKRKAVVTRSPMKSISANWANLAEISQHMLSASLNIVDPRIFAETLQRSHDGHEVPLVTLLRTFGIELWLRNLRERKTLIRFAPSRKSGDFIFDSDTAPSLDRRTSAGQPL